MYGISFGGKIASGVRPSISPRSYCPIRSSAWFANTTRRWLSTMNTPSVSSSRMLSVWRNQSGVVILALGKALFTQTPSRRLYVDIEQAGDEGKQKTHRHSTHQ